MNEKKRLGLALCGSYCTYDKLFAAAERLRESYELIPIMSETAAETDTRFGAASVNIRRLMELTGRKVITTIADAEPLGPARRAFDRAVHGQHPRQARPRDNGQRRHHGGEGAPAQRPPARHRVLHE